MNKRTKPLITDLQSACDAYDCHFMLNFHLSKFINNDMDLDNCCDRIAGDILKVGESEEQDWEEVKIGSIELINFRLNIAKAYNLDLFELFDAEESDTSKLYTTLFNSNNEQLRQEIQPKYCSSHINTILHIHRINLLKQYRGFKLGTAVIYTLIETFFDTETLITTKPFPLKWEDKDKKGDSFNSDFNRIVHFWESQGFVRANNSEFFILSNSG